MFFKKGIKAQASVELLSTYGWILISVLVAIAILGKYGFLNPNKYLPERFDFGDQLKCEEVFMDSNDGYDESIVSIRFRNNFIRPIKILGFNITKKDKEYACNTTQFDVDVGDDFIVACRDVELNSRVKNKLYANIVFSRNSSNAWNHSISGYLFAQPAKNEYCYMSFNNTMIHCLDHIKDCGETDVDVKQGVC